MHKLFIIRQLIILLIILPVFCNCSRKQNNYIEPIAAEYLLSEPLKISTIAESVDEITLQEDETSMIRMIRRVVELDDRYIILVYQEKKPDLVIYSKTGRYIRRIGVTGKGPQEIGETASFLINRKSNTIEILDRIKKTVHIYDTTGNYLRELRFSTFPDDFAILDNGQYLLHLPIGSQTDDEVNNLMPGVHLFGADGKHIKPLFAVNWENRFHIYGLNAFTSVSPNASLMSMLDDNIYSFTQDTSRITYSIDFGKRSWPQNLRESQTSGSPIPFEYIFAKGEPLETKRYIYFLTLFAQTNSEGTTVLDKKERTCKIYNGVINDLSGTEISIVGSSENELYGYSLNLSDTSSLEQVAKLHIFKTKR